MNKPMIFIRLNEALEAKGKTVYWLSRVAGLPHVTVWNLSRKTTQASINLSVLSRICAALDCEPADLLKFTPDAEDKAVSALAKSQAAKAKARSAKPASKKGGAK